MKNLSIILMGIFLCNVELHAQVKQDLTYSIIEIGGKKVTTDAYIMFNSEGNVKGKSICNKFSGTYSQTEKNLLVKLDKVVPRICTEDNALEIAFFEMLQKVTATEAIGSIINLKSGKNKIGVLTVKKDFTTATKPNVEIPKVVKSSSSNPSDRNKNLDPDIIKTIQGLVFTCDAVYSSTLVLEKPLQIMFTDGRTPWALVVTSCLKKPLIVTTDRQHYISFKDGETDGKQAPDCIEDDQLLEALKVLWETNSFSFGAEGLHFYNAAGVESMHFSVPE
jgi:heat shock protein HslJ